MEKKKEPSPISVVWGWAEKYHSKFYGSVVLAVLGVAGTMAAYFSIAAMIRILLENGDFSQCLPWCGLLLSSYLVKSVEKLSVIADIVIVDTGAGISDSVMEFVASSPEILLVTTPEPSSLTDAYSLLKMLYRNPKYDKNESVIHVLTNRVASFGEGKMVFDKLESVVKQFLDGSVHYIGIIPQDAMLEKAVRIQKPVSIVSPNARSSKRFEELAQYLVSGGKQDSSEQNAFRQFLTKLFNLS